MGAHVARIPRAGSSASEGGAVAAPSVERTDAPATAPRRTSSLPPKVFAVMALTALLTFATLTTAYELFFTRELFA